MRIVNHIFKGARNGIRLAANFIYPETAPVSSSANTKAYTLLFVHANGFHKELWYPVISRLFNQMKQSSGPDGNSFVIEKAVAFDVCHSGESAILNKDKLQFAEIRYSWCDNARDVLSVAEQLNVPASKLVGIGHSYGASSLMVAEIMRPSTFHSIFAVDPVLMFNPNTDNAPIVIQTLRRKNKWSTKEDFLKYIRSKPLYASWTDECQALFVEHGITPDPSDPSSFILSCAPKFEAATFRGPTSALRTLHGSTHMLTCPLHLVVGETSDVLNPALANSFISKTPLGSFSVVPNSSHLITMEYPEIIASKFYNFLESNP
ncbi:hypothetical protein BB560_001025 [Smittium megazygosporum]|uniref:AB hydrolase-1 domain-containing protein n=1 Tax=Smittium megazygosporum TaxID=133381 RepID=A0A2T9ZIS2_9FUNG|nr:hypothetical protein BB560_001025 [Smittium megazygosporum]